jgi:phosphohistidine phosphatase SixA
MNRLQTSWNRWLGGWMLFLGVLTSPPIIAGELDLAARLQQGGHVLMLRHAHAPGFGDPPHFKLDDCTTQRNLDASGRAQAVAAGDWLRGQGVKAARVYSSQWCRSLETVRLLNLGEVTPLPALNSFFERTHERVSSLVALNAFFARQPADGPLLILVTHFVNIQAIAGFGGGSGEGVVLQLQPGEAPRMMGRLNFGAAGARTHPAPQGAIERVEPPAPLRPQ